ncbi:hypothetical protein TSOC_003837 [Tetrabaena socialis]|uniref:Uncharacterized protein n=1 Tax=Tetrabaena socialis TaxID=47790 RepID=A0A2J8AAH5_9CHLO|nr:hypothetical protein TSOC_003837 [Tetrabaena socialis]|eukprot:PNH09518.1 hypothetical protein TSOC_003837 [Tetrabaena socialis]
MDSSTPPYKSHSNCAFHGADAAPDGPLLAKLGGVLELFREDPGRIDFAEMWRGFGHVRADGSLDGLPLSRLAKLRHSLRAHMREAGPAAAAAALDALCADIQARWGVVLSGALAAEQGQPEQGGPAAAAAAAALEGGGGGGGGPALAECGAAALGSVVEAEAAGGAGPGPGSRAVEVAVGGASPAAVADGAMAGPEAEGAQVMALVGAEAAKGGPGGSSRGCSDADVPAAVVPAVGSSEERGVAAGVGAGKGASEQPGLG